MAKKENKLNIQVGVLENNNKFVKSKGSEEFYQSNLQVDTEEEDLKNPCYIISRLDHNATITYNGLGLIIAPREKVFVADAKKIGALPKGVFIVPVKKK